MTPENPFIFGEIIDDVRFVDRTEELGQLVRDLADGQEIFLLSPQHFGKSSLVAVALLKLKKRHIHTVNLTVSSYSSYAQLLDKFAEKVLRAAGPWERVKDWISRFGRQVKPDINYNLNTGEVSVSIGKGTGFDPSPIAPDVFALPGELTKNGGFRMAICLDEFQQISEFDGGSIENAIRNQVQQQREVGYVLVGSQPSPMQEMLSSKRPFHKAGPQMFLDKIPAEAWEEFITSQFRRRGRTIDGEAVSGLLATADLIPDDVQRIAHELWDWAEIADKRTLSIPDVKGVINKLVIGQSTYYELLWEQLPARQRATLQALAHRERRRFIPWLSASSFASAQLQVFRRRSSLWMRARLSIVIGENISFWILCSSPGSDPKSHSLYAVQRYARRHNLSRGRSYEKRRMIATICPTTSASW